MDTVQITTYGYLTFSLQTGGWALQASAKPTNITNCKYPCNAGLILLVS